jgi:hypothetical protein
VIGFALSNLCYPFGLYMVLYEILKIPLLKKYDLHDSLYVYKCTIEMCVVTIFDTEQLSNDRMAC